MSGKLTRAKMEKRYILNYKDIPETKDELILYVEDVLNLSSKNIENINKKIEYISNIKEKNIEYTLFEIPMSSDRPRMNFKFKKFFVNNAKTNSKFIENKLKELNINPEYITTSTVFIIKFFLPIPSAMSKEDKYLAEMRYILPLQKPDIDNVYKTYTDMINQLLIIDDYIITKTIIEKYYSFKPRVEICIKYKEMHDSVYNENKIKKSKFYKERKEDVVCRKLKISF